MQVSVQAVSYEFLCKNQSLVCMFELDRIFIYQIRKEKSISDPGSAIVVIIRLGEVYIKIASIS
jgi:hypothetical protein